MSIVADRLSVIRPSPTVAMNSIAMEMAAAGEDVIGLAVGEPDFDTPDHIKEAGIKAIQSGDTKYTAPDGRPELKSAICRKLKRENGLDYNNSQITVGNGGKHVLYNALMATLNPGDEVIVPAPYWTSYPDMVLLADGDAGRVACTAESGFKLTPADLEAAITPQDQVADPEFALEPLRRGLYLGRDEGGHRRAAQASPCLGHDRRHVRASGL